MFSLWKWIEWYTIIVLLGMCAIVQCLLKKKIKPHLLGLFSLLDFILSDTIFTHLSDYAVILDFAPFFPPSVCMFSKRLIASQSFQRITAFLQVCPYFPPRTIWVYLYLVIFIKQFWLSDYKLLECRHWILTSRKVPGTLYIMCLTNILTSWCSLHIFLICCLIYISLNKVSSSIIFYFWISSYQSTLIKTVNLPC